MKPHRWSVTLGLVASLALAHQLVAQAPPTGVSAPADSTQTTAPVLESYGSSIVPGIYYSFDEVRRGRPKLGNITVMDPEGTLNRQEVYYLDARGRRRKVEAMDIYAYSDGASLFIRKPNILYPKRFDGFLRVVVYASIMVAEPGKPRPTRFASNQRYRDNPSASSSRGSGLGRSALNTGLSMGVGMGMGMGGGFYDPFWGPGAGWGMPVGWGMSPGGWGPGWGGWGSGMGMNANIPLNNRARNTPDATGDVAIPINPVEELYMVDSRTGEVKTLDAVYLPALLRTADPELYQEWVADTRPNHTRAKQLEFVRKYNLRHPLSPVS